MSFRGLAGRALALALCSVALVGCASFVPKREYADYRAVRLAGDDDARLLAMQRYVAEHPSGRWATELQSERTARGKRGKSGLAVSHSVSQAPYPLDRGRRGRIRKAVPRDPARRGGSYLEAQIAEASPMGLERRRERPRLD